jgi:hypothetical protein
MNKKRYSGVCKLTGERGPYVKAHIVPQALTRLSTTGEKYVETELGLRTIRRPTSWYDDALVTQAGEDVLADIDSKGVEELRRLRLVWSGWGADQEQLSAEDGVIYDGERATFRLVRFPQPEMLRLFFISLVWRAAASSRPELRLVNLAPDDEEDLRLRVLAQNPGRPEDYPIHLFQIVTRGVAHNRTPILERTPVPIPTVDNPQGVQTWHVRVYLDGMVAWIYLARGVAIALDVLNTCLGFAEETPVMAHEFERSRTWENFEEVTHFAMWAAMQPNVPQTPVAAAIRTLWSPFGRPK